MLCSFEEEILEQIKTSRQKTKLLNLIQFSYCNKQEQIVGCNIKIYLSIVDNNAITIHGLGMQITIIYHSEANEQMINK